MQGTGDDDDSTDIVGPDFNTAFREDTADGITELESASPTATATAMVPAPARTRLASRLMAAGFLAITLAAALVLYLSDRQAAPVDTSQMDAHREAQTTAKSAVNRGEWATLPALLLSRQRSHPTSAEIGELLEDATRYRDMLYLQKTGRLPELATARQHRTFHTSLFEETAHRQFDGVLDPSASIQHLSAAEDAWRSGELVQAINTVKQLATESGIEPAKALLHHYSQLVKNYETLATLKAEPGYTQALLLFYLNLDPHKDQFFWTRLEPDFKVAGNKPAEDASQQLHRAGRLWISYHEHGGIDGPMRQNAALDNNFRQRAMELTDAFGLLSGVAGSLQPAAQAGSEPPLLLALIEEEIRVQREYLELLQRFNNDPILAEKLMMLSAPQTVSGH